MRTKLKDGEHVELINQLHWSILVAPAAFMLLFFILFLYLTFFTEFDYGHWALLGVLAISPWMAYQILIRRTNLWIVTNLRVIYEYGLLTENVKETPLDRINNVTFRKPLLGRILDYGDVEIQTAAQEGTSTHKTISHPELLKDTIFALRENRLQKQHGGGTHQHAPQPTATKSLAEELRELAELKAKGILTEAEFEEAKKKLLK